MNVINLKKLFAVFIIMGCMLATPVKKAEAGVIIGTLGLAYLPEYGASAMVIPMTIAGISSGLGLIVLRVTTGVAGTVGGALLIALDANVSLNQDVLEQTLACSYPFIDNAQTLSLLAKMIKDKAPKLIEQNHKYLITLTEDETRYALETSDLTEDEIRQIVIELI